MICKKCGSSNRMPVKRKQANGTVYTTSRCRDCANKYYRENRHITRDWQRKNREYWNDYLKGRYTKELGRKKNGISSKRLRERTPSWADREKIAEFYKNRPEGHEVDHIIPLNGKKVSGLHIHTNLQYLSIEKNRRKSNKF